MILLVENSPYGIELLAPVGQLPVLSPRLPGEGNEATVREARPITGRLTNLSHCLNQSEARHFVWLVILRC